MIIRRGSGMNTWISLVFASLVNAALYSRMECGPMSRIGPTKLCFPRGSKVLVGSVGVIGVWEPKNSVGGWEPKKTGAKKLPAFLSDASSAYVRGNGEGLREGAKPEVAEAVCRWPCGRRRDGASGWGNCFRCSCGHIMKLSWDPVGNWELTICSIVDIVGPKWELGI